jgi:hypothetical protein
MAHLMGDTFAPKNAGYGNRVTTATNIPRGTAFESTITDWVTAVWRHVPMLSERPFTLQVDLARGDLVWPTCA